MSATPTSALPAAGGRGHVAYNLAGIAVLVLLLAVGLAYAVDLASKQAAPTPPRLGDGNPVLQTIAGQELAIPATWFRYGEDIKPGFASQVDLTFMLPLFADAAPVRVEATLTSRTSARASSTLLDTVYLHQFVEGTIAGAPGLVGKSLRARDGYANETVWYDPLSPGPFVAKCAAAPDPGRPDRCLRTVHLANGLAVILSFDAQALQAWKSFDVELALWLGQIGAL